METKEKLKIFEIRETTDSQILMDELKKEIEKDDYDLDYIKDLLNYGNFDMNSEWYCEKYGVHTALFLASLLNKPEIVKLLLYKGAYPNWGEERDEYSGYCYNSLHLASSNGHLEVVKELLNHPEIDITMKSPYGETALYLALKNGESEVVEELMKHPDSFEYGYEIYWALHEDNTDVIMEALKSPNFNPNWGVHHEREGFSYGNLLTIASKYGNVQVVEELLKRSDADPNSDVDWSGSTPLIEAVENGGINLVKLLLNHPLVDPNVQDMYSSTALMRVLYDYRNNIDIVKLLLSHPLIDPNVQSKEGLTALILASKKASKKGILEEIQALLEHPNINIDLKDNEGKTAWDWASEKIREQFPQLLPKVKNRTVEKKAEIESMVIDLFSNIGIDIPSNYEDIVQYIYEDVCETADEENWNSGDVLIAFRRWIQEKR